MLIQVSLLTAVHGQALAGNEDEVAPRTYVQVIPAWLIVKFWPTDIMALRAAPLFGATV